MPSTPNDQKVLKDIKRVVRHFNLLGIADVSFDPITTNSSDYRLVQSPNPSSSTVLENVSYADLYAAVDEEQSYLIKLLDGAFLQLDYAFDPRGRRLVKHRLSYLPSPELESYMDLRSDYWEGRSFVEVVGHQVLPVPIRVDFDARESVAVSGRHPVAHLTLGQYKHCRIPVSSPMLPIAFAKFIGSHFYSDEGPKPFDSLRSEIPGEFEGTLTAEERNMTHVNVL